MLQETDHTFIVQGVDRPVTVGSEVPRTGPTQQSSSDCPAFPVVDKAGAQVFATGKDDDTATDVDVTEKMKRRPDSVGPGDQVVGKHLPPSDGMRIGQGHQSRERNPEKGVLRRSDMGRTFKRKRANTNGMASLDADKEAESDSSLMLQKKLLSLMKQLDKEAHKVAMVVQTPSES